MQPQQELDEMYKKAYKNVENRNDIQKPQGQTKEPGKKESSIIPYAIAIILSLIAILVAVLSLKKSIDNKGDKGDKGEKGEKGENGTDGQDGLPGANGDPGETGKDGQDGQPGKNGADGKDGQTGAKGDTGETGKDGNNKMGIAGTVLGGAALLGLGSYVAYKKFK